jgi:hypothetical protein
MRTPLKLATAAVAVAALAVIPSTASARTEVRAAGTLDVPQAFAKKVVSVTAKSGLDVYLPTSIDTGETKPSKIKAQTFASKGSYELDLGVGSHCGGATACFVAAFTAEKGGTLAGGRRVALSNGRTGRFFPLSCGASCAPPRIEWRERHSLYVVEAKLAGRRPLVRMANSAIRNGPR